MEKIFENSMRTIWRKDSSDTSEKWFEIRQYCMESPPLPSLPERFPNKDSLLYWGETQSHTFKIDSSFKFPFWQSFHAQSNDIGEIKKETLLKEYIRQSISNLDLFPSEAAERYRHCGSFLTNVLPRDFRELKALLQDELVRETFISSGIAISTIEKHMSDLEHFLTQSKELTHGCFRFRNLYFNHLGSLSVVAGDDVVRGTKMLPQAALLSDLFELFASGVSFLKETILYFYQKFADGYNKEEIDLLDKAIFLYAVAHGAQFIFTFRVSDLVGYFYPLSVLGSSNLYNALNC